VRQIVRVLVVLLVVSACTAGGHVSAADPSYTYTFLTHAAFFSTETKQLAVIDPQVFVADPTVPAGTGPQNIPHIAGYRPARVDTDPATVPTFTAQGTPLPFTLGAWLDATGSGTLTCNGNTAVGYHTFRGLVPGGVYQLFRNQFTPQGAMRSPFGKGDASDSVFTAGKDGTFMVVSVLPFCPAPTDGVLLSFHSDGMVHGALGGQTGVNLHNQLLVRVSASGLSMLPSLRSAPAEFTPRRLGNG